MKVLALSGGVGGAKLAVGLANVLAPENLTIMTNTGDDFTHLGLRICPDLDTVMYTLAGLNNTEVGWGRKDESWDFMKSLSSIGGEDWFQLGDRDLAIHVERTRRLKEGESLSQVTAALSAKLGVRHALVPMSDDEIATVVETPNGDLPFQHYFVRDRCEHHVNAVRFEGADKASLAPAIVAALADPDLGAIVICPSNPFLSVDPLLSIPGAREALRDSPAPVVAVSPIVGGRAIKGPTAKMMEEMGMPTTPSSVAKHYGDLLDGFIMDEVDGVEALAVDKLGVRAILSKTIMNTLGDKMHLAEVSLNFALGLKG